MKEFIYDNTFEGLLTTIFYAYQCKDSCNISSKKNYRESLFQDVEYITTEEDKFLRVYKSINSRLNKEISRNVYYLYLSELPNCENILLSYLKLCYKYGPNINLSKNNSIIMLVDKYCRKVTYEAHRLTGFVRFKEVAPLTFYSSIEPVHNVLPLLFNHFTQRFSDEHFIIHDLKRESALLYNKKSAIIASLNRDMSKKIKTATSNFKVSSIDNDSVTDYEALWKTFYNSVNIEERKNHRLRNQYMPKVYWKHMPEVNS